MSEAPQAYFQAIAPIATGQLFFHLLIDPPTRQTTQTVSERLITGSNDVVIDIIGKPVTKIKGRGRFDNYDLFKLFEGMVGSNGILSYSEELGGVRVLFVDLERTQVLVLHDIHIANVEFWLLPTGTIFQGTAG